MAFTLAELLPVDQKLRTVQMTDLVSTAISIMNENQYTQLPIVGSDNKITTGEVVTFESILQSCRMLGADLQILQIKDVATTAQTYAPDSDLLETLDDIQRHSYALIVDESNQLTGIVTTADTTVFLRRYAQDIMQIEGIELRVKDAIKALYANQSADLQAAIDKVTDRSSDARKKLPGALKEYFTRLKLTAPAIPDGEALAELEKKLGLQSATKDFDDLTFNEFADVLLRHPNAPRIGISNDVTELRTLLGKVRNARNKIAHFRGELSSDERTMLAHAANWLERNLPSPEETLAPALSKTSVEPADPDLNEDQSDNKPIGSYAAVAEYLRSQPRSTTSVILSFEEIEKLLQKPLPQAAREYRAWWSNNPANPQSAAWLEEGWRTTALSMTDLRVSFVRTNEREENYIKFFAQLNARLEEHGAFPLKKASPQGQNWLVLASLDWVRPESATINAVFTRRKEFRIELYLDSRNRDVNKGYFDQLALAKAHIEKEMGGPLRWERLDDRRSCRIAAYIDVRSVVAANYDTLIDGAVRNALALYHAFRHELAPPAHQTKSTSGPASTPKQLDELRLRYITRLINIRAGLNRQQTDLNAYTLIDNEIIKHAPRKLGDHSALVAAIVGKWRSPRHDYVYRDDGTWSIFPVEENSTRGIWRIEGSELLKSTGQETETRYRILLLDLENFAFSDTATGSVYYLKKLT